MFFYYSKQKIKKLTIMSINNILRKLFGSKSERDIREVQPTVDIINEKYELLHSISNDELREKANELRRIVKESIKEENDKITAIKDSIETGNVSMEEKEKLYDQIDNLNKEIDKKYEIVLKEILPDAFAIIRETARRFNENQEIDVTANQNDKDLA